MREKGWLKCTLSHPEDELLDSLRFSQLTLVHLGSLHLLAVQLVILDFFLPPFFMHFATFKVIHWDSIISIHCSEYSLKLQASDAAIEKKMLSISARSIPLPQRKAHKLGL